ncbi:MAG: DUF177 domain-containing protein [Magnetococcales bacterium]|nr:DUF177 domain-containing protein [Magnetococcales bacterium]
MEYAHDGLPKVGSSGKRWEGLGPNPRDLTNATLDVNALASRATHWSAVGILPADALEELGAAGELTGPVQAWVEARPIQREGRVRVLVQGQCRGILRVACVRCLNEFPLDIDAEIDALYAVGKDPAMKNKKWRFEEDLEFLPDGLLKIRHLVEEELLLALPMHPVCVTGCAGLCVGCGADLNRTQCQCRENVSGGPFAVLQSLQSS